MKKLIYPLFVLGTIPLALTAAGYQYQQQGSGKYQQPQGKQFQPEMPASMKPAGGTAQSQDDRRIHKELTTQFKENGLPAAITITVENGKVTLEGNIDTENHKANAEQIAYDIDGVNHVINRLYVTSRAGDMKMKQQQQLQQKQDSQMQQNLNYTPGKDKKNVADQYDKPGAMTPKTDMMGAKKGADQDLEKKIQDKLQSGALSKKFGQVQFNVENGKVTLFGTVNTPGERSELEKTVGDIQGVKMINNNVQVGNAGKPAQGTRY